MRSSSASFYSKSRRLLNLAKVGPLPTGLGSSRRKEESETEIRKVRGFGKATLGHRYNICPLSWYRFTRLAVVLEYDILGL
jgi:hypothetical protein